MSLTTTSIRACRPTFANPFKRAKLSHLRKFTSTQQHADCEDRDVVIVGGGPAGLAFACALGSSQFSRENLSVTLIEAGDLSKIESWAPAPGHFSNRVSSLTNASQAFIRDIGAWNHVDGSRTSPIESMQVWDGVSDARITFVASELGLHKPELGMATLTENLNLQRGLLRRLQDIPQIQLLQKTKVKTITQDAEENGGWPTVYLDSGKTLRARLLVGADGFNSPVRSYANIPSYGWAYNTQAIVATMSHPPRGAFQGPNGTAYQRFLPTGPIAFLPLSPIASSLVWSTKPRLAAALKACEPAVLASMINAAFRLPEVSIRHLHKCIIDAHTAGTPISYVEIQQEILWREQSHMIDENSTYASAFKTPENTGIPPADSEMFPPLVSSLQPGTIASFPLRFNHAESYIGEGVGGRTVLVGDAAHTVHPLAGQGLNMGLSDVESLTTCIHRTLLQGGDIGSYTALLPYTQDRYLANHTLMSAVDKLHKLYSVDIEPLVWARSVGLEVLNELDSVKAALMMTAGATPGGVSSTTAGWNLVAKGMETAVATAQVAKIMSGAATGMVEAGLQRMLKMVSQNQERNRS